MEPQWRRDSIESMGRMPSMASPSTHATANKNACSHYSRPASRMQYVGSVFCPKLTKPATRGESTALPQLAGSFVEPHSSMLIRRFAPGNRVSGAASCRVRIARVGLADHAVVAGRHCRSIDRLARPLPRLASPANYPATTSLHRPVTHRLRAAGLQGAPCANEQGHRQRAAA